MKVTVAFGDVKVVVPCGNGDITIRQLSELAITRYQKSLQQVETDTDSPKMSVNINALVLARDCGILDWDDSVSDVVDDRELIIARFQNKPSPYNRNTSNNNTTNINNNNNNNTGANTNSVNMKSNNNNHYLFSEWKYCLPTTVTPISSFVVPKTDEKVLYNSASIGRVISSIDSIENQGKVPSGKNGSCLVSLSPDSVDSSKQIGENLTIEHCCSNTNNERSCLQNTCLWTTSNKNQGSFSLEESDSSQWPVPPPLIVTTIDESTLTNKAIFSNAIQTACYSSSTNPNDPLLHNKQLEYIVTKKNPLKNMATPIYKINHDTLPATTSLSSSLPSNADAKSLPQSFYSSLESTAVSDNNNSSYDETNEEIADSSKSISINQLDDKNNDESFFSLQSKLNSLKDTENSVDPNEINPNLICHPDATDFPTESVENDLSDIQEEEDSQNRSQKFISVFHQPGYSSISSNYSKASTGLQISPQMPPPMPPLRSAFTKLSPNPIRVSIQPVNFLQASSSDLALPSESMACIQLMSKTSVSQTKNLELVKSEHSIPSLFESDDRILEDPENEWSLSGKSGDQESMNTTTTTETSINTTTTTTTNSHSTLNKTNEKCILTVTLKKSSNGFGFSLTSRQNPVDLTNPVYVSKVLENGPAIYDGRMKPGDRIVMINDEDVSQLSQTNIKDILLNIAAESVVKIGLYRPNSDPISNLIDAMNTASTSQKKNSIPQVLNHAGDKSYNEDCNQICVEEQKPVSFPMCSCVQKNSQPCSKLNLFHFIIPLRTVKSDFLTPQIFEPISTENTTKTILRSQNLENKTEPPAIPLNHQNKLSPCSFTNKPQSTTKASNATLGISVRRGISQMSFNESHIDCQNACHGHSKIYSSSKIPNQDIPETFPTNNYVGNSEESIHKFCPNCHGLLSLKSGVFVKSIIPGGAAHMDGRIQNGDEIIAVQGVCLYNGEDFVPPNNKVLLGDTYDSLKFAQVPLKFQSRIAFANTISSNIDSNDKTDPLNLLKQILSHAQSICSSVSLTILRRSLEQRSCSINTLASVDANCCHNVTVAADIHTPYKNDDSKTDRLLSFIMPANLPSTTGLPGISVIHKQKIERFEENHNKNHNQRYYRDECDNSSENHNSDLICLQSDHGSDDPFPTALSDNNSLPSPSHTNNASLADSYHVSSGLLTDFENVRVPKVTTTIYNDSSVIESSVDNLVKLRHANVNPQISQLISSDSNSAPTKQMFLGAELDFTYFNRHDSTRKSMSSKRNIYKLPICSKIFSNNFPDQLSSDFTKGNFKYNTIPRPMSAFSLYQVPEEDFSDNLSPELSNPNYFEDNIQTIDRKSTLRRRGGIGKFEDRKRYRS